MILDECSYTIDKKKMDLISDKIQKYYDEIPEEIRESISFGILSLLNFRERNRKTKRLYRRNFS